MKTTITTLAALADFINGMSNEDVFPTRDIEAVIESNRWISDIGTEFGICHYRNQFLEFDESGKAVIVEKAAEYVVMYVNRTEGHDVASFCNLAEAVDYVNGEVEGLSDNISGMSFDEEDLCDQFRYEVYHIEEDAEELPDSPLYVSKCYWEN